MERCNAFLAFLWHCYRIIISEPRGCPWKGTIRFSVFDENEEDTEAVLGFATMPLAVLLSQPLVENELQLLDISQQPAGTVSISVELQTSSQPKPIQLRGGDVAVGRKSAAEPVRPAPQGPICSNAFHTVSSATFLFQIPDVRVLTCILKRSVSVGTHGSTIPNAGSCGNNDTEPVPRKKRTEARRRQDDCRAICTIRRIRASVASSARAAARRGQCSVGRSRPSGFACG
jgi:hypothetical protein